MNEKIRISLIVIIAMFMISLVVPLFKNITTDEIILMISIILFTPFVIMLMNVFGVKTWEEVYWEELDKTREKFRGKTINGRPLF
jgi:cytochrome c oxidase subunit IV